jgi:hypothetical protein
VFGGGDGTSGLRVGGRATVRPWGCGCNYPSVGGRPAPQRSRSRTAVLTRGVPSGGEA